MNRPVLGPALADEELPEANVLKVARAVAFDHGVTRLAELTGLDRIGVPVFHAVRPMSRSLCVHQGKGLSRSVAQIGALMEAVESATAEAFDARAVTAAPQDLPPDSRIGQTSDFGCLRDDPIGEDEVLDWTTGERLIDKAPVLVPFDCVSLDCTGVWNLRLDHSSNGLAARFDDRGAILKGLLEVLERDAAVAWRSLPLRTRFERTIDSASISHPWFEEIAERLRQAGVWPDVYSLPTVIGLPTVGVQLLAAGEPSAPSSLAQGWACAPTPEEALKGALLEALQVRLTEISGVRDDILPGGPQRPRMPEIPLPPGLPGLHWDAVVEAEALGEATPGRVAEALAAAGYPDTTVVRLTAPDDPVCVVKVFTPGLGAIRRSRRPPVIGATA